MENEITNLEGLLEELSQEISPWVEEIEANMEKHAHKGYSKAFGDKNHIEKAQISANFSFILQTLYFALIKLNNKSVESYTINEEIERIKKLYIKIDKVINPEKYKETKEKRDSEVTKRIVKSCLSANNFIDKQQQKEKMKAKSKAKVSKSSKHKVKSSDYMSEDSD
ncbi:unnamed protein product [Moneuplotes crassus]|uniref:Nuclear nucleic acid-binding protein C1D n=1 Tax=Euplotes crassus TaxID=5936 RepID=A0AAD1Y0J1_EUPCR|nr:unnamed protein product [Moneuplotes crassus]